jgi:hypothetical protein
MCQPILETERTIVAFRARRTNFVKGTVLAFAAIRAVHFHSVVVITHIVHLLSYFIVVPPPTYSYSYAEGLAATTKYIRL